MRIILLVWAMLIWSAPGFAQSDDGITYVPAPEWVVPVDLPAEQTDATKGSAGSVALVSYQFYLGKSGSGAHYERKVLRISDASALQSMGTVMVGYAPGRYRLNIHHLKVHRQGSEIDILAAGQKFSLYRTENQAAQGILHGFKQGFLQIADLRVGDLIDLALTMEQINPMLGDQYENEVSYLQGLRVDRLHHRATWHKDRTVNWYSGKKLPDVQAKADGNYQVLEALKDNVYHKPFDQTVPLRLGREHMFQISTFANWTDVATALHPVYEKALIQVPSGEMADRIAAIATSNASNTDKAMAALRLVQREVRYSGNFEGLGNYQPEPAQSVWDGRYGDCKGKTVLLVSMLLQLGIEAVPALVSVNRSNGIEANTPMMLVFDHVIVRASIDGKIYWLDGTRQNDRSLATLDQPGYQYALPLIPAAKIEKLPPASFAIPTETTTYTMDASSGFDVPAKSTVSTVYRGETAAAFSARIATMTETQRREHIAKSKEDSKDEDFKIEQIEWFDRPELGEAGFIVTGTAKLEWEDIGDFSELLLSDLNVGHDFAVERTEEADKQLPVESGARHVETLISIRLPTQGKSYSMTGSKFDRKIGPARYVREATLNGRAFSGRSLTQVTYQEMSMTEAERFDRLSDLLYNDRIFILAENAGATIKSAERSAVQQINSQAVGGDLDGALTALAAEIKLRPKSASLLHARAKLLHDNGRPGAERELQKILLLDQAHSPSLQLLAEIYAKEGDLELAHSFVERLRTVEPQNQWAKRWPKLRKEIEAASIAEGGEPAASTTN